MNEEDVRRAAEAHVGAIVDGRLEDALSYVVKDLQDETAANLSKVAHLVASASVEHVRVSSDEATVTLRIETRDPIQAHVRIESEWWEIDGHPKLVRARQI